MRRVLILVEGQTEETFVKEVLNPHLIPQEIFLTPRLATTKVVKDGPNFKGGLTSYPRVRGDIQRLLKDSDAIAVTTMFDLYGLPANFPDYSIKLAGNCYARAKHLEEALYQDISDHRFRPYLQIHEFEAFLFVAPEKTAEMLLNLSRVRQLEAIRNTFNSPEEINDHPDTAPSKRIRDIFPGYQKAVDGPLVSIEIGLDLIRQSCTHFNEWLTWLENLKHA